MTVIALRTGPGGILVDATKSQIRSYIATETILQGQAVYRLTTGKCGVADANASGKQQCRGIALNGGGAGQAIEVVQEGIISGFVVAALDADALVYLSDTAGALDTAAGTMSVPVGRVICMADKDLTKVLEISINNLAQWS